tara:strand:- start:122 stop:568 length:447 start_codon:yes stop_codon:yes gene_type:complete
MDYAALRAEIDNDPESLGYASYLPDAPGVVVDLVNSNSGTMVKTIRASTAMLWAAGGAYASIFDASNDANHPARASCLIVREAFASNQDIHLEMQSMRDMLDAWVVTAVITQGQKDALLALANQPASRGDILGLGRITEQDLRTALEL